jgi:uncharacterized iron-regulated protein
VTEAKPLMALFPRPTVAGSSPLTIFLLAASISMINPAHADADPTQWQSSLHNSHPLVGHIWDNSKRAFITRDELLAGLIDAELLLLGEKHDNPDHHRLRLTILERLMAQGQPVLLALEMLTESQQGAVDSLAEMNPLPLSEDWQALLSWDDGWTWAFYEPALSAGLTANATIIAGNLGGEKMMQVYRAEPAEHNQVTLNETQLQRLTEEIDVGHCGMLPAAQIPPMVRVQQARDEQMARALMTPGDFAQRILLAGNFHIRHDLSVPNYLAAESEPAITVAFLEVDPAATQVADYLTDAAGDFVYDFIWFTPAVRGDDYCADMTR